MLLHYVASDIISVIFVKEKKCNFIKVMYKFITYLLYSTLHAVCIVYSATYTSSYYTQRGTLQVVHYYKNMCTAYIVCTYYD